MTTPAAGRILDPGVVARLGGLRLATRRRVTGRYSGGHRSKRHGTSMEFSDFREYVAGDDPRRVDLAAYRRLGRLLVKVMEAEDEAPVRVVLDTSPSMQFGRKAAMARELTAALTVLATAGQDPVRVLLAGVPSVEGHAVNGHGVEAGPWLRGRGALPQIEARLLKHAASVAASSTVSEDVAAGADASRQAEGGDVILMDPTAALVRALHRAHGEGARGPVVLISDLLFEGFGEVLRALAGRGGDTILLHVVGRDDLEPGLRGDLRVVDIETGAEVEVAIDDDGLAAHAAARDAWLDEVDHTAGRHGITLVRVVDDEPTEDVILTGLRARGVVA